MLVKTSISRLREGDRVSVLDLLSLFLLESSNEAALAIAAPLGESQFIKLMNIKTETIENEKAKYKISAEEKYDCKQLLRQISQSGLDTTKLKENDHRILGQKLDLFSFNDVAPGIVFWHNNGLIVYNELVNFWREEHRKAGYEEISTPFVLDKRLWQISGHWEKYRENIFLTKYEGRDFAVKPMNCPGGILVYKARTRSYRELPLKVAELGIVHRHELSGVLAGLFRVIRFTQDDAHIYCTEEQLEQEIGNVMGLVDKFYKKFGFEYHVEFSTRPEKRIGSDDLWDKAEQALGEVLKTKRGGGPLGRDSVCTRDPYALDTRQMAKQRQQRPGRKVTRAQYAQPD